MYIIGTVGPNVKDRSVLKGIIDNGVNVLRFNFAHGSEKEFLEFMQVAKEINEDIKIVLDLSGNKIRISNKFQYIYKVYSGEEVYFCGEDRYESGRNKIGKKKLKILPLNIKDAVLKEKEYKEISIKDNTMKFKILGNENGFIKATTMSGGIIRKGKGCNIKDLDRFNLSLNSRDKDAIIWGIKNEVDIICQSFIENKYGIEEVKSFLKANNLNNYTPKIWAKIETLNGIRNINSILKEVDGIVIGRGDLIPETSIEHTPIYEEIVINESVKSGKDVIIATHILNSMKEGKVPAISEVESVYNFIKAGVTGFLLAGETSVGRAPIKTVEFLKNLINKYGI